MKTKPPTPSKSKSRDSSLSKSAKTAASVNLTDKLSDTAVKPENQQETEPENHGTGEEKMDIDPASKDKVMTEDSQAAQSEKSSSGDLSRTVSIKLEDISAQVGKYLHLLTPTSKSLIYIGVWSLLCFSGYLGYLGQTVLYIIIQRVIIIVFIPSICYTVLYLFRFTSECKGTESLSLNVRVTRFRMTK